MTDVLIIPEGPPTAGTAISSAATPPPVKPVRITQIKLCDFRAFAGPEPVNIALDGKNLLIYGENGAGKSSIFHALDEFFSVAERYPAARKDKLKTLKNIFSGKPEDDVLVEITFDDGAAPAKWNNKRHPVDASPGSADSRVVNAAFRKAILDYRSLLETNFRYNKDDINLFDVCVNVLLRDFPSPHNGKGERLFDLWQSVRLKPHAKPLREYEKTEIRAVCSSINGALDGAMKALCPIANEILAELGWGEVKLKSLQLAGLNFKDARLVRDRRLLGEKVTPVLEFLGQELPKPQNFLNEARLSALALAIYFAGRELCAATLQAETPRIMVLDDVLIGLDQSNRLPVLDVISKRFSGWQIILLTHDRVWFEMARMHLQPEADWKCIEMFEGKEPSGLVRPVVKPANTDTVAENIAKARSFHAAHEYSAATVHARMAFELILKKVCDRKSIPVRFRIEAQKLTTDELLTAFEKWLADPSRAAAKAALDPVIASIKMNRKVVLNPFSHSAPVTLAANEVLGAIAAIEKLKQAIFDHVK
jgi:energy-coupling factor transporter ATP-binding protein EcfA2